MDPPERLTDERALWLRDLLVRASDAIHDRVDRANPRHKDDGSVVTDADLASEAVIIEALQTAFPDDTIISEEAGRAATGGGGTWHVDPLDGTSAFSEGLVHWGPTVSRSVDGELEFGGFYVPRLREFWFAAHQGGAWRDGERLRPREPGDLVRSRTLMVPSGAHHLFPLPWRGKIRALGSTAAHMALVAAGSASATVVGRYAPWDVGCGTLLVREAGRCVTDLSGAPFDPMSASDRPFFATARDTLPDLIEVVNQALAGTPRP